jgi:hypothetical protein
MLAQTSPEKFLQQAEVCDLNRTIFVFLELEVTRGGAFAVHHPQRYLRPR